MVWNSHYRSWRKKTVSYIRSVNPSCTRLTNQKKTKFKMPSVNLWFLQIEIGYNSYLMVYNALRYLFYAYHLQDIVYLPESHPYFGLRPSKCISISNGSSFPDMFSSRPSIQLNQQYSISFSGDNWYDKPTPCRWLTLTNWYILSVFSVDSV